ncbi:MAG TPA: class I SAM-dependent methyltransferase [Chlamydiales bacterium]|nr:class I SAM-dependent methyltransferase [Chlamydiales bacterium]
MKKYFWILCLITAHLSAAPEPIPAGVLAKIQQHIATCSWVEIYYDVMPKVIRENQFQSLVEVGVALGGNAEAMLQNTDLQNYYGVDPYLYNFDPRDPFNTEVSLYSPLGGKQSYEYLYSWVKEYRLAPFGNRAQLIRDFSVSAAKSFEDESIDCIFIDGDHRYEYVVADLKAWFPKVKKGGMMLGDDYWQEQVAHAVNDFFAAEKKNIFFVIANSGYKIWAIKK